ncbi:MAG: flagellar basal body-associated FliL family protein [Clostridia bacterium]|nr:flagellar basal body-associated FliL family protein [Clostridia bacterium]
MAKKALIIIIIAVVFGLVGAGAGVYFMMNRFDPNKQVVEPEETGFDLKDGSSLALNDVMISLKKTGSKASYLKASFVIVFEDEKALATAEKMTDYYRDAILSVFESKTAEELSDSNKRNEMKEPVLEAIRSLYNNEEDREKIIAVMIPSFIVT